MKLEELQVSEVDFDQPDQRQTTCRLLNHLRNEGANRYGMDTSHWVNHFDEGAVAQLLTDPQLGAYVILAQHDDRPVGLAICQTTMSSWYLGRILNIHDFFVVPDFRSRGVGSRMLDQIESKARSQDYRFVSLETNLGNPGALRLYLSRGYKPCSKSIASELENVALREKFSDLAIALRLDLQEP